MIKAVIVFNHYGKPRLIKFYQHLCSEDQQIIIREIYKLISRRSDNVCNFLEGCHPLLKDDEDEDYKVIYRHYATLYFVLVVDSSESELGILDLIQVLVESLDKCFENVCELDLIFHADKVQYILQEMVMGGMVLETTMLEIVRRVEEQNRIEKSEAFPYSKQFQNLSNGPRDAVGLIRDMNLMTKAKDLRNSMETKVRGLYPK
ncbi:hypothetical protein SNEBB_002551 [Seison nebaliae]|nr:hypothetical protein SNEBB_002551 [Seison nebaliae]